jgi:hypothetical protein
MCLRVAARRGPALTALLLWLALVTTAERARAWVEMHVANDDVRVSVEASGRARVEHRVTLKISGGPLRAFDIMGVDGDAVPMPDGYVVPTRDGSLGTLGAAIPIAVDLVPPVPAQRDRAAQPPKLHVRFEHERGLGRGVYVVVARYATDLTGRGLIVRDGSLMRIRWTGAAWDDGLESAHATFELPAAPTEPRPIDPAAPSEADLDTPAPVPFLSSVRRSTERDEIELVRPYAPKGEPIVWTLLADSRAFSGARNTEPLPIEENSSAVGLTSHARRTLVLAAAASLFVLYAIMVFLKFRESAKRARGAGTNARPLLPAPLLLRAPLAALALVAGIALEWTLKSATPGAALVALATALSVHRSPPWKRSASLRKPGRWLPISEEEALAKPPRPTRAPFDVSTRFGKALLLSTLMALAGGVWLVGQSSTYYAYLLALDATPLLAIFCTGRLRELPPDPVVAPAGVLRNVAKHLRRLVPIHDRGAGAPPATEVRLVPRIHVPDGEVDADELRLCVVPRPSLTGFVAIEIGVVYVPGSGGALALPEVLLRVQAGTDCERACSRLARHGHIARGRRPNETVIRFTPRLPTARMTAQIAATLAAVVLDPARAKSLPDRKRAAA